MSQPPLRGRHSRDRHMNFISAHLPELGLTVFFAVWIGVVAWAFRGGRFGRDDDR